MIEDKQQLSNELKKQRIASESGTSPATVRRALHPDYCHTVSLEKRTAIEKLAAEYGYDPKHRLKKGHQALGLMVPFSKDVFSDSYHTRSLTGIAEKLQEIKQKSRYDIKVLFADEKDYHDLHAFANAQMIDGLFILMWRIHPNLINWVLKAEKPYPVMLFNEYDKTAKAHFVVVDVGLGIEKAVHYLVERRGRKAIAFLKGPTFNQHDSELGPISVDCIDSRQKYEGFERAMRVCGLEILPEWVKECCAYTEEQGYLAAKELFNGSELPDALITSNDATAIGALKALKEKGIACPEKVAVIGYDGSPKGEYTTPKLTTVRQPLEDVGAEAARQLVEIVQEGYIDVVRCRFKFDPELVIRESA